MRYKLAVQGVLTPEKVAQAIEGGIMKHCGVPHCLLNLPRNRVY